MALEDYEFEAKYCSRCSQCKWIPLNKIRGWRFAQSCPAISRYNLHAYSGGGRVITANSLLQRRSEITDELREIIFRCQLCGACQVTCHLIGEIVEPLEIARELKIRAVEEGKIPLEIQFMVDGLKREDNVFGEPKAKRGDWAEGLDLKDINEERVDVIFHAGCRFSYDGELRGVIRDAATLLKDAGVNLGIAGREEGCCGGRVFDAGYRGEMEKYADDMIRRIKASGASKLVTPCSDCYGTFKYLYPMIGHKLDVEVLHITELIDRLMSQGKIRPVKEVRMRVTYHDPCHLGRLGETYEPWNGEWKKVLGQVTISEPQKQIRRGAGGVYDPPRRILKSIPGLELVEMDRRREWSWCCGAGGGVKEAYEDFALWTAKERIEEARSTGADAIVTACPWCERNFKDVIEKEGMDFMVYDVVELLMQSLEG